MKESIEKAKEELKRADHLIYVSLKYTRTVDVIKNIIKRLINAFEYGLDALLEYARKKKKIEQKPVLVTKKCEIIKKLFKEERELVRLIDFYLMLRKIDKAEFTREREYRRHVTMTTNVDGEIMSIDIDLIYRYFERTKEFMDYVIEKVSQ